MSPKNCACRLRKAYATIINCTCFDCKMKLSEDELKEIRKEQADLRQAQEDCICWDLDGWNICCNCGRQH